MSGARLLDTCTLSYYLDKKASERIPKLVRRVDQIIDAEPARLSIVTVYEINRGLERLRLEGKGGNKIRVFSLFFSTAIVYEVNEPIWRAAAHLHAVAATRGLQFGEADLLILVTAQLHRLTLVTTDAGLVGNARNLGLGQQIEHLAME